MEVPHAHNQAMAGNQLEGLLIFPKNRQQLQQQQQQQQQEEIKKPRPHQEQPLKCPRCASTNTKFCYYNNYSLSQPRYFCKACRRYWTQGGSLRNVPVGGGCRKNKTRNPSSSTSTMSSTSTVSSSSSKNKPQDLIINPPLLPPASTNSFHIPPLTSNDLSLAFSGLHKQLLLDHHSSLLAHANSTGGFLDILRSGSIDALSNSNLYFGGGGGFAANDHHHHNNNNNVSTGEGGVLSCNNVKSMAEGGMGGDASMRMVQTVDTGGGGGGGDWNGSGVVGNSWHGLINGGRIMDNVSSSTTLGDAYAFF